MSALYTVVALVALQRLAELALSHRNTRRLRAAGGVEVGAGHYPLLVSLHVAWLGALVVTVPADAPLRMPPLALYIAVQGLRYWAMAALGENWTTRIITVPGRTPIRHGPYRYLRHPNYMVVACEIAVLPLIFGAWRIALLFTVLNGAMLAHRIRIENAALAAENSSG